MKIFKVVSLLIMATITLSFIGCSDDEDDEYPYTSVKGGGHFVRANTVRFYYIDENGNDLIDPDDVSTLPVSYNNDEKLPESVKIPNDFKEPGGYNGNANWILFDKDLNLFYMQSSVYGDMEKPDYTFYIGFGGEFDKMDMSYRYTDKNVSGGNGYAAKIVLWKFNGKHVYSDDEGLDKKVFVKKAKGKTTISFSK